MKIAIVEFDFADTDIEERMLAGLGAHIIMVRAKDPQAIIAGCQGADAVITSYGRFTREVFAALAPTLKVVSRTGVGVDDIDIQAANEFGVAVCNVPGYGTEVVSDHAIALALACLRRINEQDAAMRNHIWDYARTRPLGQCRGRRFGVVGMGAIGRAVARKAAGLGFQVACWSRSLDTLAKANAQATGFQPQATGFQSQAAGSQRQAAGQEYAEGAKRCAEGACDEAATNGGRRANAAHAAIATTEEGYLVLPLEELVATSDVLSLHVALTPETRQLIDEAAIASMKPGAVLVNTARGAVVDTRALADALAAGRLWGAGLDVFEGEPLDWTHPIMKAPHTVLTPHAAYWSEESGVELRTRATQAIIDALAGRLPQDCLNPHVFKGGNR